MKKRLISVLLAGVIISFICVGCVQEKKGHIMRDDITMEDLEFVYEGTKIDLSVSVEDMYDVLGLPHHIIYDATYPADCTVYTYYFEDDLFKLGIISFNFYQDKNLIGVPVESWPMVLDAEPFDVGKMRIDRYKYRMVIRENIQEEELSVIDETSSSETVQDALGAPHDFLVQREVETRTIAYIYPLTNGNLLLIAYERNGVIAKAWVVDKEGSTQKVLVDRTDEFGVYGD